MSSEIPSSDGESSKDRQENELISISAIFPNEVFDLRAKDAWKMWRPLELQITILPEGSMTVNQEVTVKVDLYLKCTDDYPNSLPKIEITNVKGISNKDAAELKASLVKLAKQHIGEEMILELISGTKAFLHGHTNKPQFKSCHEEMVFNQQKLQEDLALQEKMKEDEKHKYGKVEQATLQKVLMERKAAVLKSLEKKNISIPPALPTDNQPKPKSDAPDTKKVHVINCDGACNRVKKLNFKSDDSNFIVLSGQCMGHNKRGCIVHTGFNSATGENMVIIEWSLPLAVHNNPRTEEYKKMEKEHMDRLAVIEQEVRTFAKLKHDGLVRYLGMTCVKEKNKIVVYLLQEFVQGSSLFLFRGTPVTIQQLQFFCRGILLALQFLHENSIVHKDLRETSIFIDRNGCVRLSDYSIDKRLYDINRICTGEPELNVYPPSIGKGGKKCDIYRLGVLLLNLHLGSIPKSTAPVFPPSLNSSFKDFLRKCLVHDVQERWSAEQLLSHSFLLISSIPNAISKGDKAELDGREEDDDEILSLANNSEILGGSRLKNEFDILKHLGSGGFGNVLKVRNKLDARIYALKCIPLNPSNKQLNRKIKREVKLLSRLNHENIVRYYNSWIETTLIPESSSTDTSNTLEGSDFSVRSVKEFSEKSIKSSVQWSDMQKDVSSSEDEDDDCDMFGMPFFFNEKSFDTKHKSSGDSCSIVFANETNHESAAGESPTVNPSFSRVFSDEKLLQPRTKQFMYIQMEFCEKSTLRTAIDNKLHKDTPRVWRLFREIVEGLHHIHQQGMIHRDLKPANVFLDSYDHVKIGDFGLATTSVISNPVCSGDAKIIEQLKESHSDILVDDSQTGNVGTALYLAPELASASKCGYDHKVDLYSLGIIFFEMCYPPPVTAMERIKLIMNLRLPSIALPPKTEGLSENMKSILKWLLQHDPKKRPDSSELLASDYIPPLLMEETELQNLLQNTVSNPQSRIYKHMINTLFNQEVRTEFEFTYDTDIYKSQSIKNKQNQVFSNVVDTLNKVARKRGAVYFSVPMLMPKCTVYGKDDCVHVMDHGGGIVTLPRDLRVPFARHIARREVNLFKRFTLEKVYREHKVFGCHPREQYEYAFDIITPTPCSFMPDAEVLAMVCEIIAEFPSLQNRNYYIRLNHVLLLKAVAMHCELKSEVERFFYRILSDFKNKKSTKLQFHQQLSVLDVSEETLVNLCRFIEVEDSIEKVKTLFQPLLKKKGQAALFVQKSFRELQSILEWIELFDIKQNIVIAPGLAHDVELFSGAVFQFVCEPKKSKNKGLLDILAAGGRYDKLISSFKVRTVLDCDKEINHSAVGVSIAVERIVSAELNSDENQSCGIVDVLVHSTGDTAMLKERIDLLQQLWSLDISATIIYDKTVTLDDAEQFCRDNRISHIFILKDSEPQYIKIRSMEKDKVTERRILCTEVEEYVPKLCTKAPIESYQRSRVGSVSSCNSVSSSSSVKTKLLSPDKLHNSRKRESQILAQVTPLIQSMPNRPWEVLAVDLTMYVLGSVALHCDISEKVDTIHATFASVIEKHPRHKKLLVELCDEICDIKTKRSNVIIVIFSLSENNFRVLL